MAKKIDNKKIKVAKTPEKERMYKPNPEDPPRPGVTNPASPRPPKPIGGGGGFEPDECGNGPISPVDPRFNVAQVVKDEITQNFQARQKIQVENLKDQIKVQKVIRKDIKK